MRVAWADAATSDLRFGTASERLGAQQQRRLSALSGVAAERFVVGRELLALVLDELAAEAVADGRHPRHDGVTLTASCDRCGGEHGALRVRGGLPAAASVSYADSMVVVAAASLADATAIGVDIEREPSDGALAPLRSLTALFDPAPAPSTREWTLLEAALKADGRGITVDVATCRIESSAARCAVSIPGRATPVAVATIPGPAGFVLSVAAIAPRERASTR